MADDSPSSWREEALLALRCQQYQQIGLSSGKWNFQEREQENAVEEEKYASRLSGAKRDAPMIN